ncbi:hypothetical protein GSI_13103 [Ganoderma sinense ZZ0214-1]|uniref:F-box domain-containing protein n=1 Tax=Ganoderma sinense ZZ0214-1 TaxID=1077348 RepID=A0A2G8RUQ7_9APHY|nr:hypothetical protein GSI_13103 [Ganoderma sinense ZZ0214-1]
MTLRVQRNACPDLDVAAHARKQLESEVAKHVDAIIDLKGRINAMAPISKLPPELLSAIFTEVAITHYTGRPPRSCCGATLLPYKWITLTHVCHSWRAVALNTPRLWSRIVLTRPDVTREVLARSKKAPLWVTANMSFMDEPQKSLLDAIMRESSRVKELSIAGPARILENLYPRWTGEAPLLESLSLSDNNVFDFDPVSMPSIHVGRPSFPVVFQGVTPNLRNLNIHHVSIRWDNPLFCSTLTSLTVISRYDNSLRSGNFGQLLLALETMTALESLELNESIPRLGEDLAGISTPLRRVTLPNLRKLSLVSDAVNCANLLNFVTLPPTARLLVTGHAEAGVDELVGFFTAHLTRAPPLLSARLAPTHSAQVVVRGWWTFVAGDLAQNRRSVPPAPDTELIIDAFPHARAVQHVMACAPALARVRRLEIQPLFSAIAWDWRALFAHTPALRVLSISGHAEAGGFIAALSQGQPAPAPRDSEDGEQRRGEGEGTERGKVLLPELHTLRMADVRFGCWHPEHEAAYLEEMVDWLIARCNEGAPIATLTLQNCVNAGADDVERLREVVADVVWDGLEIWEEDDEAAEQEMLDEMYDVYGDDEADLWPIFPAPDWDDVPDYGYEEDEFELQWMIPF